MQASVNFVDNYEAISIIEDYVQVVHLVSKIDYWEQVSNSLLEQIHRSNVLVVEQVHLAIIEIRDEDGVVHGMAINILVEALLVVIMQERIFIEL